jgi:uncharacterized membrane protein (DUF485 family)
MNPMAPHGTGIDFTWVLTIGVVVYSFIAFAAYLLYAAITRRKQRHEEREGS